MSDCWGTLLAWACSVQQGLLVYNEHTAVEKTFFLEMLAKNLVT